MNQIIGGTGQENLFSGNNSRDTSCFVIKWLENKRLRAIIKAPISKTCIQRAALAFVDDANLHTNRIKCKQRI